MFSSQSGWSGAGYTTIDPATGAGGYIIDGGTNGGWLANALAIIQSMITWLGNNPVATLVISIIATLIFAPLGLIIGGLSGISDIQGLLTKSWNPGFMALAAFAIAVPFLFGLFAGSVGWIIALAFVNFIVSYLISTY